MVRQPDLRSVRIPVAELLSATLGKEFTHIMRLSPSSIIWYRPMGGDTRRLRR